MADVVEGYWEGQIDCVWYVIGNLVEQGESSGRRKVDNRS